MYKKLNPQFSQKGKNTGYGLIIVLFRAELIVSGKQVIS